MSTPAPFAKRINVSVKAFQKWDRFGILPANAYSSTPRRLAVGSLTGITTGLSASTKKT